MTARQLYEGVLIELNKENAPNLLLEDFNYFANKAINNYVNKRYNIYDINQQTTDDLRVLKATAILKPKQILDYAGLTMAGDNKMATYEVIMPSDYLHILNCICIYKVNKTYKCYNAGDKWRAPATRLTADMYSQVLDNFWNKPTYKRPYYYIHNVNTNVDSTNSTSTRTLAVVPTDPYTETEKAKGDTNIAASAGDGTDGLVNNNANTPIPSTGTPQNVALGKDGNNNNIANSTGLPKTIKLNGSNFSNVERGAAIRYGNVSQVRLEIRYGTDTSVFELSDVYVDYIKAPQNIRLTQLEIDKTEDISQMLEYPDYVCQEIINELVHLVMENISDQRLQTHPVVSQSIANPAQQQTPDAAQTA